ncbi:glycoside hydrolase family 5 protein [Actinoplanes sp. KI2]|uniref:glycoside hydrolase family 5 protein n=1 Tax=Actinoplanes sp. KI2 TaxID=2983315 RepID=UPI0021D5B033|nr:glycoside hydrolase family 5 protein [Actinoplanes sp. KI2]MCU7724439.1 glycoside hydrolase family 5 protein [Actinoplanes sp. KI2]
MTSTVPVTARPRSRWVAPQIRAAAAAVVMLLAVLAVAAASDPSGLLAPIGGRGLPVLGSGGVYRWAPLVVGLPVLLAGTAVPAFLVARQSPARWVFAVTWIAVVGAGAWATAASGFASALPMVGPHLPAGSALAYALGTSGFAAIKFLLVGWLVAAGAALAARFGPRPVSGAETGGSRAASTTTAAEARGEAQTAAEAREAQTAAEARGEAQTAAEARGGVQAAAGETFPVALSMAVMVAVTALAAIGPAAHWWHGGPVGYAFAGFVAAPTAANGVLGFLAGVTAFLALFAGALWLLRRGLQQGGPLTVCLASVVAGLGLGVVDAVLVAMAPDHLAGAGPDQWWIATSLISVATGIGYGAVVGLIGAVAAGAAQRLRSRPAPQARTGRRPVVLVAAIGVLVLALAPVIGASAPAGPPAAGAVAASGGMEFLRVLPAPAGNEAADGLATIGDVTGRQVILRGVNVNQLIDYYLRDPAVPATQALTDGDFEQMAAMGFNVIRLGLSWSRLEPQRGTFDQSYLRQIQAAVAGAKAHGIYTVLDMHEDAWGNALARPAERCGGGTTPTTGWDGAPAWATITDGTAHCQFLARDLAPAVATAFENFYTDRDGIQGELVRTWAFVAQAFANEPAVAGYDLLNEPGIGAGPPISSGLLLGRYYDAAITAIRAAERAVGGHTHLAFFEPSVLWSGLGFDVAPAPGFTDDRQVVFAPHPYSESISMDQGTGLTIASIERNQAVSARAARAYGAALWFGEWGWFGEPAVDGAKLRRFAAAQDRLGAGGAFWVWRQGCGSPETGDDATTSGNLVAVDCRTGASTPPPAAFALPLSRAFPRALPGRLDSLTSGPDGGLRITATAADNPANCLVDIWVPGIVAPRLTTTGVADASSAQVKGGWRITGCARGAYTVSASAA